MEDLNNTFSNSVNGEKNLTGEMSIDDSLVASKSPPQYVTFRKEILNTTDVQDLRNDFQVFQAKILSMMESWFSKHDERFTKISDDFSDIKSCIKYINCNYEDLKSKTEDVVNRVTVLEEKSSTSAVSSLHLLELENKIDTMEQQARMTNIEISNLPEKRGENLPAILANIATLIKVPINKQDVISIHRVPQAKAHSSRPKNIIVKFSTRLMRDNFISAVRLNKGVTTEQIGISGTLQKIYVNEHLTLKNKTLFRATREAAAANDFKFVWIKHGTILTRANETTPVIAIRGEKDLSKIKSKG